MSFRLVQLLNSLLLAGAGVGAACAAPASGLPVDLQIPVAPAPLRSNGATHLVYELHITNFSAQAFELDELEILDDTSANPALAAYRGPALGKQIMNPGSANAHASTIGAGAHVVVFLDATLANTARIPHSLRHRLHFSIKTADGKQLSKQLEGASVTVSNTAPLVLQAPLRGEGWLAYDVMNTEAGEHRRTLMMVNGKAAIAQRFAIDWVKLGQDGRVYHNRGAENANWYGYGAEVLAVADAVVAELQDGLPDNIAMSLPATPVTLDNIGGNYLSLDLGGGRFAFYAHLQRGSLRVKVGDKVRAGQVLGLLGNSGNSDGPHLHFHVTDRNSILGSEGMPYAFRSFTQLGSVAAPDQLIETGAAWQAVTNARPSPHQDELPANFAVIAFP